MDPDIIDNHCFFSTPAFSSRKDVPIPISERYSANRSESKKHVKTTSTDDKHESAQHTQIIPWIMTLISLKTLEVCKRLSADRNGYSSVKIEAAGFIFINGDTARCNECGLEFTSKISDIKPFNFHKQQSPSCSYVCSLLPKKNDLLKCSNTLSGATSNVSQNVASQDPLPPEKAATHSPMLVETNILKVVRQRSFSHWDQQLSPSYAELIQAGFFSCNVGDRVICLYCNLICQQWKPYTDNPWEVHNTLSPKCPFVLAKNSLASMTTLPILNESFCSNDAQAGNGREAIFRPEDIVTTSPSHRQYSEMPRREATFASTWPRENLPSVEDLVRAGFFYTGTQTIVTCFYCNGSLQNWGPNDNPMIEHARWFPNCAYSKQLCGAELYRRVQESKRAHRERNGNKDLQAQPNNNCGNQPRNGLVIPDESTLSRYVAARLDLKMSQRLIESFFKVSIVKRCWEDQLRLKRDDFTDFSELFVVCLILQRQIDIIGGNKEKITVPIVAMQKYREQYQPRRTALEEPLTRNGDIGRDNVGMTSSSESDTTESKSSATSPTSSSINGLYAETNRTGKRDEKEDPTPATLCALCLTEERQVACIPCGHLCTCVPCGHSLRSCPMCRQEIRGFVRIYL